MACHAVQMWSLSGLVAAFLDLTIAYLLLCASAAAYLASKFLAFFGLNLPCPCDGMFINLHSKSLCFNRLLVEFPIQKLSDVQLSVRQKFPFADPISPRKYDRNAVGDNWGNGVIELEGEASCSSSVSDARGSADVFRREISSRTGKIDMKGKGILSHRPKSRLRYRKGLGGHGKNSSLMSCDPPVHEEVSDSQSFNHLSSNKRGSWCTGDGSLPSDNAEDQNLEYDKAPKKMRGRQRTLSRDEINIFSDEDMYLKESMVSGDDLLYNQGGDENSRIWHLEQALERERGARAALYTELEMERSAAASAADEAMAMILRLQADKASIEMEARQYQRMIEEKSAYDDEEMDILQEILMRREKEKLFLEKEVESYREMVSRGNEQSIGDFSDNNDDPVTIQHRLTITASTDDEVKAENKCGDDVSESTFRSNPSFGIESPFQIETHDEQSSTERLRNSNENFVNVSDLIYSGKMDLEEEVISSGIDIQLIPKPAPECKKTISSDAKQFEQSPEMIEEHKLAEKVIGTCYGTEKGNLNYKPSLNQQAKDAPLDSSSCNPTQDKVPHVYDVHIVNDGINLQSEATSDKSEQLSITRSVKVRETNCFQYGAARERIINDSPSAGRLETDPFVKKNISEVSSCLPPIARKGSSHSLRRSSMSALDTEMVKIDTEIIQLQERLKLVQESREKLSFSLENRETKNVQLNILEDIARQIQEIRHKTEPKKSPRQASLPPPNSKGLSKRRRSRSVSSGFLLSSEG